MSDLGGRLREVSQIAIWLTEEPIRILVRLSLKRGGRLREAVAQGGSTVCTLAKKCFGFRLQPLAALPSEKFKVRTLTGLLLQAERLIQFVLTIFSRLSYVGIAIHQAWDMVTGVYGYSLKLKKNKIFHRALKNQSAALLLRVFVNDCWYVLLAGNKDSNIEAYEKHFNQDVDTDGVALTGK